MRCRIGFRRFLRGGGNDGGRLRVPTCEPRTKRRLQFRSCSARRVLLENQHAAFFGIHPEFHVVPPTGFGNHARSCIARGEHPVVVHCIGSSNGHAATRRDVDIPRIVRTEPPFFASDANPRVSVPLQIEFGERRTGWRLIRATTGNQSNGDNNLRPDDPDHFGSAQSWLESIDRICGGGQLENPLLPRSGVDWTLNRISLLPARMVCPDTTPSHITNPFGASTMIVDPCSNHPISRPLVKLAAHRICFAPRYRRCSKRSRKCSLIPATRIAATGTSATVWVLPCRRARITARSLRQNSRSTRASAIGLTFHVSPAMYVTCRTVQSAGAWKRWYIEDFRRSVAKQPPR